MKLKTNEAIDLLKRSYNPQESIFIWVYGFDEFDDISNLGNPITQQDWDDADDNCDLIDDQIRDSIELLLQTQ